jgi:hypothetical protein
VGRILGVSESRVSQLLGGIRPNPQAPNRLLRPWHRTGSQGSVGTPTPGSAVRTMGCRPDNQPGYAV